MKKAIDLAGHNANTLYSQANTWRWPGRHVIHRQNIAEHHAVVTQLVLLILDNYNVPEEYHLPALRRAVTHDLAEAWTNDIPYVIKRDYPDFAKAYDKVEADIVSSLPEAFRPDVEKGSLPWLVVKLADSLDVYLFTKSEVDLGSKNPEMVSLYLDCQWRILDFEKRLISALERI